MHECACGISRGRAHVPHPYSQMQAVLANVLRALIGASVGVATY
jgi:hypothetical protein